MGRPHLYFLRPLDFRDDYVFGWEHETSIINGAILRPPPDSAVVREHCGIPHLNWRPPFYGMRKSVQFYWRRLSQGDIRPENYRWGTFGPAVLTYLAKKHRVSNRARERAVFYPIPHGDAKMFAGHLNGSKDVSLAKQGRSTSGARCSAERRRLRRPAPGSTSSAVVME